MISIVELLVVAALAIGIAQCVVWLLRMIPSQSVVKLSAQTGKKGADHTVVRSAWGETTRAHFRYVRRRCRYQVHCPAVYQIDGEANRGVVVDISREGWRVKGPCPIAVGKKLSLTVTLPGIVVPVPISQAEVRWSEGDEFGIRLVALDEGPAVQLSEFFSALSPERRSDPSAA